MFLLLEMAAGNMYGIFVSVECGACQGQSSAHLSEGPSLVDFSKCDAPRFTNGVYQPYVFLE